MKKPCVTCGQLFTPVGPQRYCKQPCEAPSRAKPARRTCDECGTSFQPTGHVSRCTACVEKNPTHPRHRAKVPIGSEDVCVRCGAAYTRTSGTQRYCSPECRFEVPKRECRTCGAPFRPVASQQYCAGCKPPKYERVKLKRLYDQFKQDSCARCDFQAEHSCQLDVHHRDGDFRNNEPSNLETLCANCHRLESAGIAVEPPAAPSAEVAAPSEADVEALALKLKGQGMTTPVATREARKRLGL